MLLRWTALVLAFCAPLLPVESIANEGIPGENRNVIGGTVDIKTIDSYWPVFLAGDENPRLV